MIFNTRLKKIIIYPILIILSFGSIAGSVLGWFYSFDVPIPQANYVLGHPTISLYGLIISVITGFLSSMLFLFDMTGKKVLSIKSVVLDVFIIIALTLVVVSLILGIMSSVTMFNVGIVVV